ncbi:MAG: helix-turn-helix transcriptional regulator [Firmicutes bacterium]|nr:helix-turn-helix transcriptional regulator [Bacillota bacterium]
MRISTQKNVGSNLRTFRMHKNMSQAAMADVAGLTRSLYVQYELGNRTPDAEALFEIARHFGINMDFFFEVNADKFIGEVVLARICKDGGTELMDNFSKLTPFSKGRLLEKSEQLIEWDKFKERNYIELEKRRKAE